MKGEIITIVGLGLMGGSLAAALKRSDTQYLRKPVRGAGFLACRQPFQAAPRAKFSTTDTGIELRGVDIDPRVVAQAVQQQIVHEATTDLADGVSGSTVVVLATPVRTIVDLIGRLGSLLEEGCLLLDLGSTKADVVEAMAALPAHVEPVGGHPLCGREVSGLAAADATMFQDKAFVLCPLPHTRLEVLARAETLVRAVGARPLQMDAIRHDRLVAATSHLPYLLAVALIAAAEGFAADDDLLWDLIASGFRDTSRLAASDLTMMIDILMTNRAALGEALAHCRAHLDRLATWIESGDETALWEAMRRAQRRRKELNQCTR